MATDRFGALEVAEDALWLGAPRARRRRGGIRLGYEALSQWGGIGRRHTPWDLVSDLAMRYSDPKMRSGVEAKVARVLDVAGLAIGIAPGEFRELNGGVRLDWVAPDSDERCWGVGAVNWDGPLSPVESYAATAVPLAFVRSTPLRHSARDADALRALLEELSSAVDESDVDGIIALRA